MSEKQQMNELQGQGTTEEIFQTASVVEIPYAGFWMRAWAYLVDLIIISSLSAILLLPLYFSLNTNEVTFGIFTVGGILSTIIGFTYFTLMTKILQQTIGKQVFGIKVYSYKGIALTWLDVIFREIVGRYIHQSLIITNLLYLVVAFSSEKRGIHDRIGNTFVGQEPRKGRYIPLDSSEYARLNPDS